MRDLVRCMRALEHRVHDSVAAQRQEFAGGVVYSNPRLPAVWDANFLRLDRACPQPALEADRLQAGLGHRHVLVEEDRLIERFGPGLRERGFGEDRFVALARVPGGELDPNVRELTFEDVRALRDVVVAEQMVPSEPTVIAQLVEASALSVEAGGRWLVLFEDGSPAAHCVVYSHLGLAQIEDVATLAAYRRRGCARRLIEHALELLATDHDAVFIVAEAEDWPLAFYERLGFLPVEQRARYLLTLVSGG